MSSSPGAIRCSSCGKENFAFVSFCHACGEPLQDPGDADLTLRSPDDTSRKRDTIAHPAANSARQWVRWESGLGAVILLLTIGYALFSWKQGSEQADAYHQGIAAEQ